MAFIAQTFNIANNSVLVREP